MHTHMLDVQLAAVWVALIKKPLLSYLLPTKSTGRSNNPHISYISTVFFFIQLY